jgi:hypothetical protein
MHPLYPRIQERILLGQGSCWLWTGTITNGGYGQFYYRGKREYAHRVVYGLLRGPIPDGMECDHLCRVRRCVNPRHIELVTRRENILRGLGPSAAHAVKERCPKCDGEYRQLSRGRGRRCQRCEVVAAGERHKRRMREDLAYAEKSRAYQRKKQLAYYHARREVRA